jgi:hypothetical protein
MGALQRIYLNRSIPEQVSSSSNSSKLQTSEGTVLVALKDADPLN